MNYTIEEILEHTPSWVNAMFIEILRQEMEQSLTMAAMFGMKQTDIINIRRNFEQNFEKQIKPNLQDDIRTIERTGGTIIKIKGAKK